MLNSSGSTAKHNVKIPLSNTIVGIKGSLRFPVHIETKLRTIVNSVGGTNVILIQGTIEGSDNWTTITTVTGANVGVVSDISTYDYIRYNITVADGDGELISSAFLSFI